MPPPPPPKYDDEEAQTGQTGDNAEGTGTEAGGGEDAAQDKKKEAKPKAAPRDPADKDDNLEAGINSDSKISRLLMMSLAMLLYPVVGILLSRLSQAYQYTGALDILDDSTSTFSTTSDDEEESLEHQLSYSQCFVFSMLFLLFAILCHMYYFTSVSDTHANGSGGPLSFVSPILALGEAHGRFFKIATMVFYALGILLFYVGVLVLLSYLFDEDYSPYDGASDDAVDSQQTQIWGGLWPLPLYAVIAALQHWMPDRFLKVFECRVAMFATVIWSTLVIWLVWFANEDYYDGADSLLDDPENVFQATMVFVILVLVVSLVIALYAGMGARGVLTGAKDSEAAYPAVYKRWVWMAIVLFVLMLGLTLASACTTIGNSSIWYLWIGTIMIMADVLF